MPIPSTRLLIWLGVLLPWAAVAPLSRSATMLAGMLYALWFLLAVADLLMSRTSTSRVRVVLPEVVRLSKDRPGAIPIAVAIEAAPDAPPVRLALGLPTPPELAEAGDVLTCLVRGDTAVTVEAPCTPTARGRFVLDTCHYELASPLALWLIRRTAPVSCEVRVYPNLLSERKRLAALFLNRSQLGIHAQRVLGQGRDFEKLREYIPGDNFDDIHWKATAKRGHPVTKLFQIERTQEIYVVVDHARLSGRTVDGNPVLEQYLASALILGLVAERQKDLFGLLAFSDRVTRFLRAAGGKAHYNACRDALYLLRPRTVSPDFEELFTFMRLRLRRRALVLILTDLSDPATAEAFTRHVELVSRRHVVLVCGVAPPGVRPLFDAPDATSADDLYVRLGRHLVWRRMREVGKTLQRAGIGFRMVGRDALSTEIVTQYMNIKSRQLL